jgi:hypothetical protein
MALNFPTNPTFNQVYVVGNLSWKWDGVTWRSFSSIENDVSPINPVFTYTDGVLTSIAYSAGETKTFTYTSGLLTRLDFYNLVNTIRKTFNYTDGVLTSITQVTL